MKDKDFIYHVSSDKENDKTRIHLNLIINGAPLNMRLSTFDNSPRITLEVLHKNHETNKMEPILWENFGLCWNPLPDNKKKKVLFSSLDNKNKLEREADPKFKKYSDLERKEKKKAYENRHKSKNNKKKSKKYNKKTRKKSKKKYNRKKKRNKSNE